MDYSESNWGEINNLNTVDNSGTPSGGKVKSVPVPASCCKNYLRYQDDSRTCDVYSQTADYMKSEDIWQIVCTCVFVLIFTLLLPEIRCYDCLFTNVIFAV